MGSRKQLLQARIDEAKTRWKRLAENLKAIRRQRDYENRIEEKLRLDAVIADLEKDLAEVERELLQGEAELERMPDPIPTKGGKRAPLPPHGPLLLFYSYAHEDKSLRDRLEKSLALLKRQGIIEGWHDGVIKPGSEWDKQIIHRLHQADLILLLISPDFIASDYIWDTELPLAMERHQKGEARVIPVILRETDWHTSSFASLQALPTEARPVTSWTDPDAAFKDIAQGIRRASEDLLAMRDRAVSHARG